jgi:hypothetical protein
MGGSTQLPVPALGGLSNGLPGHPCSPGNGGKTARWTQVQEDSKPRVARLRLARLPFPRGL